MPPFDYESSELQMLSSRLFLLIDKAVGKMDSHYESIEDRHSKILDNVQDIQQAINFISEVASVLFVL